jgi:hypothetical protein
MIQPCIQDRKLNVQLNAGLPSGYSFFPAVNWYWSGHQGLSLCKWPVNIY